MADHLPVSRAEPDAAADWDAYVTAELAETVNAYLAKPAFLVGHAGQERQTRKDYAGRELLELLQNAADAAAEASGAGRVLLELRPDGLIAANTGAPFRSTGVNSLMTANLSDKPLRRKALIGAKGLGFRAVLNWTPEPFILSGNLAIGFSAEHAQAEAADLAARSYRVAAALSANPNLRVPILAFPLVGDQAKRACAARRPALVARAQELRDQGFDTVIVAPFSHGVALRRAAEEFAEFRPEVLLFVETLQEITLREAGKPDRTWRKQPLGGDRVALELVTGDQILQQTWIVQHGSGYIPEAAREENGPARYAVAMAVRADASTTPQALQAYFPTSLTVPLPVLLHATLDLDSSRKLLNERSSANTYVLQGLGAFLAASLEALADAKEISDPVRHLNLDGAFPKALSVLEQALFEEATQRRLVDTFGGARLTAPQTRVGPARYWSFLPERLFPTVARCVDDATRSTLEKLGAPSLPNKGILAAILKAELNIAERATIVAGFVTQLPTSTHDPRLLVDSDGRRLRRNNTCFPPSAGTERPSLPRWASARFLDRELWEALSERLGGTLRERLARLRSFGIEEYSLDGLVRSLVRQAERFGSRSGVDAARVRSQLLGALFRLFEADANPAAMPVVTVRVPNQAKQWRPAVELHLSSGYGLPGRINQALYAHDPERLLAPASAFGLPVDHPQMQAFAEWIGVKTWPRSVRTQNAAFEQALIMTTLPETFEVSDGVLHKATRSNLRWGWTGRQLGESIADLEGILRYAQSEAIVAWLAHDPRLQPGGYAFGLTLEVVPDGKQTYRRYLEPLPDPVRSALREQAWLLGLDGLRHGAGEVMLEPGRLTGLFARPAPPADDLKTPLNLEPSIWIRGLLNAGVAMSLSAFGEREIYQLLANLEARHVEPEVVRSLYLQVLALEDFDPHRAEVAAKRFKDTGSVLVRQGGQHHWRQTRRALYADRDTLPTVAREPLALIDLPTRRNANHVLERFGVAPVSRHPIQVSVSAVADASAAIGERLRHRFNASRPYLAALRRAASHDKSSLARLERLEVRVVSELIAAVDLPEQRAEGPISDWSHLLLGDVLYVVVRENAPLGELMALSAEALADGLAELFEVQGAPEFAKLLSADTDNLRLLQIRRALQNLPDAEVDALLAGLEPEVAEYIVDAAVLRAVNEAQATAALPTPAPPIPTLPTPAAAPTAPSGLSVIPITSDTPATLQTSKTTLRIVGRTPGLGGGPADPSRSADAEDWADLFERERGRFPLKVAHLHGTSAFGCDIISFASEADRDAFKGNGAAGLVVRFIEVKSGHIQLTDNEAGAARREKTRYFIYRVAFEDGARDLATLTTFCDPFAHPEALDTRLHIHLERTANRETFALRPASADPTSALAPGDFGGDLAAGGSPTAQIQSEFSDRPNRTSADRPQAYGDGCSAPDGHRC